MANERTRQLRRNRTLAERRLWWKLRELKQAGLRFRQQVSIDHYIVDFACFAKRRMRCNLATRATRIPLPLAGRG